jgi:GTP-binding protein HflX
MSRVGEENALFISATHKENFEEFRERVYEAVRQIHITRFLQQILYPDYKDAVEKEEKRRRRKRIMFLHHKI